MKQMVPYGQLGTCWINENGQPHKEDGPAVLCTNGTVEWWIKGKRHRIDGPAIQYADGTMEWYINDRYITAKIQKWAREYKINLDKLTEEDKFMIRLHWENYNEK